MLEYLEKFKKLPADIQQKISSQEVLLAIDDLTGRYGVDLAGFVMRVMVGEILFKNLLANLVKEYDLEPEQAELLEAELRDRVFHRVQDYLLGTAKPEAATKAEALVVEHYVEAAEKNEGKTKKLPPGEEEKLLPGKKPPTKSQGAGGKSFLDEDAKEIEALKKNMPSPAEDQAARCARVAEDVLSESGLNFPSEGLVNRFKQIIITYARGIRTKIEVRETMLKPVINGGLNLDGREADRILAIANKKIEVENKKAPLGKVLETPADFVFKKEEIEEALGKKPAPVPEAEYDLAAEIKKGNVSQPPDLSGAAAEQAVPDSQEMAKRTSAVVGGKKKMEDIKTPKVMSPIDELGYMDLVTFRRLDADPVRRCKKIEDKITLLGKEGIDRQLAGIKAWRLNPVNKTYLSMGQESIAQGKDIDGIIVDRKGKGLNYLTRAEFEAIMDLNNRLRF